MPKIKNRWLIALSAVGIHISIGSVYSWSVFSKPLHAEFGWKLTAISLIFSLAIVFLGSSAAFMGRWVEKQGPRKAGMLAAILWSVGLLGAGVAVKLSSLPLLYLTYGVIGGMGLGIGYITPVSSLVKWFPDRRGLATGLAIMGFGFGSLLGSKIIAWLITEVGIANTFFTLGVSYFIIMMTAASYIQKPPENWMPANYQKNIDSGKQKAKVDLAQLNANEAIRTRRFYYLWVMLFINITCGIAVIAVASPMAQEITGMTAAAAASMVAFMGLFNGGGRIGWASFSDWFSRPNTYITFFVVQMVAFAFLPSASNPLVFDLLIFVILTCYGGGFACIPAYIGDYFGTKQLAAIHGYVLTAWACAGLVGPTIESWAKEGSGSYHTSMYIFVGLMAVALVVSVVAKLEFGRIRRLTPAPEVKTAS